MARDLKNTKRKSASGMSAWSGFAVGLSLGLAVALGVHLHERHAGDVTANNKQTAPLSSEKTKHQVDAPAPESAQDATHYDFYDVLPKFEVVVPNQKKDSKKPGDPAGSIDTPGTYVIQVGSYKNFVDADRVRAQLALQGVESSIQKVSVDADTWHRVRIGPISDLNKLEVTRRKLREAQVDAMVIKLANK